MSTVTPYEPVEIYDWLSFTPAHGGSRGAQDKPLGAHAFMPEDGDGNGSRSLCGYVPRAAAGPRAGSDARRCEWCKRVIRGQSKRFGQRGWL
jgi:hypothetical protein